MRHKIAGHKLGRFSSLRKATIRDIAKATLIHQRICTTKMKAKEARKLVERLVTLGKKDTLAAKRKAFAILCDHQLVSNLFKNIATRFKSRMGGYTRIIPLSERRGDRAHLVFLELTEKEIIVPKPVNVKEAKEKTPGDAAELSKEVHRGEKKDITEAKKEQPRSAPTSAPSQKDKPSKDKSKPKNVVSGIKRLFTKKPSE